VGRDRDITELAVDLFKNGENISDIATVVENRPRSGRPRAMDDRGYRQL
jgi:hypothetical protein